MGVVMKPLSIYCTVIRDSSYYYQFSLFLEIKYCTVNCDLFLESIYCSWELSDYGQIT